MLEKALGEGLVGHARYEAAGLLELRGAMPLYTFPFLFFFTLAERRVSASGRTLTVLAYLRLLHLSPLGSAFRGCDGAGAAVAATRGVPCNARRLTVARQSSSSRR